MAGVNVRITASDQASAQIKGIHGLIDGLKTSAKSSILTGIGLGSGVAAFNALSSAAHSAVGYIGDSIDAASALAESQSKVSVVFGDSADEIEAWAEGSARGFGQSKQAALEAVGTYGNLFQAFGIGREQASGMSKNLVQLAADLASFNNTSVDDALVALRSGLSGETEPLKRFGIALNDARMRSVLAAQGVTDLGATLTAQQKATAAYAIIMQDSALAQGDFGRTSDGLANQQRILAAEMANVSAEVGEALLPLMKELVGFLNDSVVPALHGLVETAKTLGPVLEILGDVFRSSFVAGSGALEEMRAEAEATEHAVSASGATTASNWTAMGLAIQESTETTTSHLKGHWTDAKSHVVKVTAAMLSELADSLVKGQTDWQDAWDEYVDIVENDLTAAAEIAELQGKLVSDELVNGLNSGDAEQVAAAEAMKARIEERLIALQLDVPGIAQRTGTSYTDALSASTQIVANVTGAWRYAAIQNMTIDLRAAGLAAAGSWIQGFTSMSYSDAAGWLQGLKNMLVGSSPPPEGPLKDIDTGGFKIGQAWAEALAKGMDMFRFPSLAGAPAMAGGGYAGGIGTREMTPIIIQIDGRTIAEVVDRQHYYMAPTYGTLPRN